MEATGFYIFNRSSEFLPGFTLISLNGKKLYLENFLKSGVTRNLPGYSSSRHLENFALI